MNRKPQKKKLNHEASVMFKGSLSLPPMLNIIGTGQFYEIDSNYILYIQQTLKVPYFLYIF